MNAAVEPTNIVPQVTRPHRQVKVPKPGRREVRRREAERMAGRAPKPMTPPSSQRVAIVRDRDALNRCAKEAEHAAKLARAEEARLMAEGRPLARRYDAARDAGWIYLGLAEGSAARFGPGGEKQAELLVAMERLFVRVCAVRARIKEHVDQARSFRAQAESLTRQLGVLHRVEEARARAAVRPIPPASHLHLAGDPHVVEGGPTTDDPERVTCPTCRKGLVEVEVIEREEPAT